MTNSHPPAAQNSDTWVEPSDMMRVAVAASRALVPVRTVTRWAAEGRLTCTWPEGFTFGPTYVSLSEVAQLRDLRDTLGRLPRWTKAV